MSMELIEKRLRVSSELSELLKKASAIYEISVNEIFRKAYRKCERLNVDVSKFKDMTTYKGEALKLQIPPEWKFNSNEARKALKWYLDLHNMEQKTKSFDAVEGVDYLI